MTIRVRFAPSPTGNLHIGTVRAALFNWLFAKANNGKFVMRIEDTDFLRSEKQFEKNIYDGIHWLGMIPDEGPYEGGACEFYRQSERIETGVYLRYATRLIDEGKAYYCFLTPEEIEKEKVSAIKKGIPYLHSRKSSEMSQQDIDLFLRQGKPYAIRFKMTEDRTIIFSDLVRGDIKFDCSLLSDFVLMKSDGSPSYNFAVVVDDADMAISHVIRGEDHISNVPRQLAIYNALGFDIPQFAHLPMILGPDKSKLSKRHGATSVTEYKDRGFLKESILNYLALLGWSPIGEQEMMSFDDLCNQFTLERVHKAGAVFDIQKLMWMNGQYIRQYSDEQLYDLVIPYVSDLYKTALMAHTKQHQILAMNAIRDNLDVLSDVNRYLDPFLMEKDVYQDQVLAITFNDDQKRVLRCVLTKLNSFELYSSVEDFDRLLQEVCEDLSLGKGKVLKPIRLALTAIGSGPNLAELLAFHGVKQIQDRFNYILN